MCSSIVSRVNDKHPHGEFSARSCVREWEVWWGEVDFGGRGKGGEWGGGRGEAKGRGNISYLL